MFYVLSFFFGASIGSYVLVVATRLNVASITKTRSKCLSCGEALRAYDLVPIFSYLFLKGKCRYCKSSYGISALVMELIYGTVFVLLYHFFLAGQSTILALGSWLVYYTFLFITLGVIALYDKAHTFIPVYYIVVYLALTMGMLVLRYTGEHHIIDLFAPFVISSPFFLIWLVSRGRAIGFGDVVLFFGVGSFFGLAQGVAVLLISVWTGAVVGIVLYLLKKGKEKKNMVIPFVPFIVFAFLVVLFTDMDVFSIASLFT